MNIRDLYSAEEVDQLPRGGEVRLICLLGVLWLENRSKNDRYVSEPDKIAFQMILNVSVITLERIIIL